MRFRFVGGMLSAILCAAAALEAQIPGRNVNMVSGAGWPDGDPMLQRQNEPSVAASTRNPLHLLAGANDYRTVDLPGLPDGEETGDAWLGLFKSKDGGQRWTSTLLPGYPQDGTAIGQASPIKGYQAAADPVVRAGSNGLLYYSGLVFDRAENGRSAVFVARFIDNNNQEAGDPFKYLGTSVVARDEGAAGGMLDKPWMAVDVPRGRARTCVITTEGESGPIEQRLPAGAVHVAYSMIASDAVGPLSQIYLTSSGDCGATWSRPVRVSRPQDRVNQGATIAIDPRNGAVHVTWRRFDMSGDEDAMMIRSSAGAGRPFDVPRVIHKFHKFGPGQRDLWRVFEHTYDRRHERADDDAASGPETAEPRVTGGFWSRLLPWRGGRKPGRRVREVENISPFDEPTSEFDLAFRTNAYPTLAIDGTGRLYMAWTERGFATHPDAASPTEGDARIVMTTSADAVSWTAARPVEEHGQRGHQLMPSLAFAGGKLLLVYYDLVEDRSQTFKKFVDDRTPILEKGRRHTIDIRVSMGTPGAVPVFEASVPVSDYMMGARSATGPIEQLQVNPPNLPMFKLGTAPFVGDYIDLAPAPAMVPDGRGGWRFNTDAGTTLPVFHAVWTDNRDVRPPSVDVDSDGNPWNDYTPPRFAGPSPLDPLRSVPQCTPGNAGSRNQNVYTARITGGLLVGSPGNTKPLSTDLQRAFVAFVQNTTAQTRSFRLTILNQPLGGRASFDQFPLPPLTPLSPPPLTVLDLTIGARSSASRTVYVTSSDPHAPVGIDVSEIDMPGAPSERPGGLEGQIVLNPDILNPEIENPEIENPEIENPEIENAEVFNPEIENPEIENPEIENPEIENPEIENPEIENPEIENIRIANPEIDNPEIENLVITNPEIENPEIENPEIENPEIENGIISDITWQITNAGNTTAAFNVNVFLQGQQQSLPQGVVTQLIIYRTYKTPVVDECSLKTITQNVLIANIPSPDIVTPGGTGFHDPNDPSEKNATLWLAPGDVASVTLRVFDPDTSNNIIVDGASVDPGVVPQEDVDLVLQQQGVDSDDAKAGVTEPPIVTTTGSSLFFLNQPFGAVAGTPMNPVAVQVRDTAGVALPGVNVSLSLGDNPTGATLLGGGPVPTGADGIAMFTALNVDRVGLGYTLVATAALPGLNPVGSLPFTVTDACVASGVAPVSRFVVNGPGDPDRPKFIHAGLKWGAPSHEHIAVVTEGGVYFGMINPASVPGAFSSYPAWYSAGTGPGGATGTATGDFTGDGHHDLLVSKGAANLVALLPISYGFPGALSTIPVGGFAGAVASGRLNADANLDFAVVRTGDVAIFFGDGTGQFATGPTLGPLTGPTAVALADIDGDLDTDVLVADVSPGAGTVAVFRNDGGSTFTALTPVPVDETPRTIVVHDFDHDGHVDFATGNQGAIGTASVRFGDGAGAFPRTATIDLGFSPDALAAGDFNSDGLGDIAVTQATANRITIWFARPGSPLVFHNPQSFATDAGPVSLATSDFNADGRADIAAANRSAGNADDLNTMSVLFGSCGAATADLRLHITEDQEPVAAGSPLTHTAVVTNQGAFEATAVHLDLQSASLDQNGIFVGNVTLTTAVPTQGTCTVTDYFGSQVISCDFGSIPASGTASVALHFTAPVAAPSVYTGGFAVSPVLDLNPGNNGASQTTTVVSVVAAPIAIDTSALPGGSTFYVESGGLAVVPLTAVGGVTNVSLLPGAYRFHAPAVSATAAFDFSVTAAGVLDFAPALDALVGGRGTQALTVLGRAIRVDTLQLGAGAAQDASDDLFVASAAGDQVLRYSGHTGAFAGVFAQHASLWGPGGITFGPDGRLYAAGVFSNNIVRFDGQTGVFVDEFVAPDSGGLTSPTGIAFGPDGHLYVASRPIAGGSVLKFDGQSGAFLGAFVAPGSGGLDNPIDMLFGPDGRLYVSSYWTHSVLRYDGTTGAFIDVFASGGGLNNPSGLAFGADGNLYVTSSAYLGLGVTGILRFDGATGAFIDVFVPEGSGGYTSAIDITFGPDGHLYATSESRVLRYDGTSAVFIDAFVPSGSGGLNLAAIMAFRPGAQRPAPGSYALLSDNALAAAIQPSGSVRDFHLLPGTYRFRHPYASATALFDFTITPAGTVDFDPALDAYVSGRGTSTLAVRGHQVAIDTSAFDASASYVISDGSAALGTALAGSIRTVGLLPGSYTFSLPYASSSASFAFNVTPAGRFDFDPSLDAYVSGRGTTTLVVAGYPIGIDTSALGAGANYMVLSGVLAAGPFTSGAPVIAHLLPGDYTFHLPLTSPSTSFAFTVTAAGTVDFSSSLDGFLSGRGTSTLVVSGHQVSIDTTAFSDWASFQILSGGVAVGATQAGGVVPVRLLPGTYAFHLPPYSPSASFTFTVTPAGVFDFAPALDSYVGGRGSSTLIVSGYAIGVDTTAFSSSALVGIYSGGAATGPLAAGAVFTARLLPGSYTLAMPFSNPTASVNFSVTAGGTVDFAPALDGLISGRGTNTLVVVGHPISIDTTAIQPGTGYVVYANSAVASSLTATGGLETVRLMPGDYRLQLPYASPTTAFDFSVTVAGTLAFASALDAFVTGRGTTTLTVLGFPISIDTSAIQANTGWALLSTSGTYAVGLTATGGVEAVRLLPGDYHLQLPYASPTTAFDFSVTPAGTLAFAPALDAFVTGRGTTTLTVLGFPISIDTSAIQSNTGWALLSTSGTYAVGLTATGGVEAARLLPGDYHLQLPYGSPTTAFDFSVTPAGTLAFASALDAFVTGRGTTTLTVLGFPISIDTSAIQANTGWALLSTSGTFAVGLTATGGVEAARLLPGDYHLQLPYGSPTTAFDFSVTPAGTLAFAPALDAFVTGRGTTTLTVLGFPITVNTSAIQAGTGWAVTSISGTFAVGLMTNGVETVRLLPGDYRMNLPFLSTSAFFDFTVTPSGTLAYAAALDPFVSGRNTSTLTVTGFAITVDTTALSSSVTYHLASGSGTATDQTPAGGSVVVRLLPGDYSFVSGFSFAFTVLANGTIDFSPAFEPDVAGRGTTTLTIYSDPNTVAADLSSVTLSSVTNTNDSSAGSLRPAILNANAAPDVDTIRFLISGAGRTRSRHAGDRPRRLPLVAAGHAPYAERKRGALGAPKGVTPTSPAGARPTSE